MKLMNGLTFVQSAAAMASCALLLCLARPAACDSVIYDNHVPPAQSTGINTGPITLSGTPAPEGYTWSETAHNTGDTTVANFNAGFSASMDVTGPTVPTGGYRLADDFTVPPGPSWLISEVRLWAYQTGAAEVPSPFDKFVLRIWNGRPGDPGSTIVFGNLTTNRLISSTNAFQYRIFNTIAPVGGTPPGITRRVWRCDLSTRSNVTTGTPLTLAPGTYWLEWQGSTTNNAIFFQPPVTTTGSRTQAGDNARWFTGNAPGAWADLIDGGNPDTAADVAQDMAFQIFGTVGTACQQPLPPCQGDVSPNGVVDIDDLFVVINHWGENGNPNGPRPPGDCAPGTTGNCLVDIDDLFQVINLWGACPPPTGACCLPAGSCLGGQTAAQCAAAGGTYQGDNVSCANVFCPVIDDDDCVDAMPLVIGGAAACQSLATATADVVPDCDTLTPGFGRWYTVVGNGHNLQVDTCTPQSNGLLDSRIHVYCGTDCSDLTCVAAANSDSCNSFAGESLAWCAALGQKYWILVETPSIFTMGGGNYCVKVTDLGSACTPTIVCGPPPPPPNDECSGATTITCGSTNTVTADQWATYTVNPNDPITSCEINSGGPFTKDKSWWYKITTGPAQTSLRLSMCTTDGSFDTLLGLFSGSCGALTQVACDDDFCSSPLIGPSEFCAGGLTPNTTYYVLVQLYANSAPGDYKLVVDCATPCSPPPTCAACVGTSEGLPCLVDGSDNLSDPNGGCNNTIPAFSAVSLNQKICGISSTYSNASGDWRDTDWYVFQPAVSGTYTIQVCAAFGATVGFLTNGTADVTACGPNISFVGGGVEVAANTPTNIQRTLTAGTKYAVFIAPSLNSQVVPCPTGGATYNYQFKVVTP